MTHVAGSARRDRLRSAAAGLNDVQREKVLWRNAAELYTIAEREGSRL